MSEYDECEDGEYGVPAVDTPQKWFMVKEVRKMIQTKFGELEDGMTWDSYADKHAYNLLREGFDFLSHTVICAEPDAGVDANWSGNLDDAITAVENCGRVWANMCYHVRKHVNDGDTVIT